MTCRRKQHSLPSRYHSDRRVPNNVDRLAFKYMEMCKVGSSTDSDSETSPRWSDTSTMGCVSSTPECGTFRRTLPLRPAARHGCTSLFLDPYDGSSEDSDESVVDAGVSRRSRQQGRGGGGCRFSSRSRRLIVHQPASAALREVMKNNTRDPITEQQHPLDVQMKCGSDSELWVCEIDTLPSSHSDQNGRGGVTVEMTSNSTIHTQTMDMELQLDDSGLHTTGSSTPHTPRHFMGGSLTWMLDRSSERSPSPCNLQSLSKRKLGLPGAEVVELGQRKRQCVVNMEEEDEAADSASEPC